MAAEAILRIRRRRKSRKDVEGGAKLKDFNVAVVEGLAYSEQAIHDGLSA